MKSKYLLKDIRDVWINSYKNDEIEWLEYLEAPFYFAKQNDVIISKTEQINSIRQVRKKPGSKRHSIDFLESSSEIREHSGWATVIGSGLVRKNGIPVNYYSFFELWIVLENRWQVASLCIDDIEPPPGSDAALFAL